MGTNGQIDEGVVLGEFAGLFAWGRSLGSPCGEDGRALVAESERESTEVDANGGRS